MPRRLPSSLLNRLLRRALPIRVLPIRALSSALVACLALAAGCVSLGGPVPPGGPARSEDFAAFRERRLALPEGREPLVLVAVGDIMLSRGVAGQIERHGDIHHPFSRMKGFLRGGDIVFGNLECPLTPGRKIGIREMVLRADPGLETALAASGFTILSLANNHTPDFGADGIRDTLRNLSAAGIQCVGAGMNDREAYAARYIEEKGVRLAFLAYTDPRLVPASYGAGTDNPGIAFLDMDMMRTGIENARRAADFLVVSLHFGTEYAENPDANQIRCARAAVDAGADFVLGHHPHVVQRMERYRGKYILYSLGNFVFDQMWSRATREGLAVKLFIDKSGVKKMEFAPLLINNDAQPEILTGEDAEAVLDRLETDVETICVPGPGADDGGGGEIAATRHVAYPPGPRVESRLAKIQEFDLDNDGVNECYSLRDGRIEIRVDSRVIWRSPDEWWVDYFFLGDANNDGVPDLNLSVWKQGSFGPQRPFWVDREDGSIRNHLFIFDLVGGSLKPVWQSSNLDRPNYEMTIEDFDGDGRNELVALEGDYEDPGIRRTSVWRWNGWGFSRVSLPPARPASATRTVSK